MVTVLQDFRFAFRMLVKNPGAAVIAILTLGVGIGATTAVFSVVDGVLLRSISYEDPHRTVWIYRTCERLAIHQRWTSIATYWDWKDRNAVFDNIALMHPFGANIMADGIAERVSGASVTEDFFSVLGVRPLFGAVFAPGESAPDPNSAVISYGLWRRAFGGERGVLGAEIMLDGKSCTIVGVMPAGFSLPYQAEVWRPLAVERAKDQRTWNSYIAIARLRPGVTLEQAQANMRSVSEAIGRDYPSVASWSTDLITLQEDAVGSMRRPLLVLFGAVGFVLLITCANVASLLLARAHTRHREVAVRAALGAGRRRLIQQFLIESLVLSFLGACLGVSLSFWGIDSLLALSPDNLPRLDEVHVDGRVLGFVLFLMPCVAILFGIAPALGASKPELCVALKEGGRTSLGRSGSRIRAALVVSEIALSLILLVGAGLLIKTLHQLRQVDPGVQVENLLTMRVDLPSVQYPEDHHVTEFFRKLLERGEAVPGVVSVGLTTAVPISEQTANLGFWTETGSPISGSRSTGTAEFQWVSHDYLRVVGQRLKEGRLFDQGDHRESAPVAIINETMARKFWSNQDPEGRRIRFISGRDPVSAQVVGVVSDVRRFGLDKDVPPEVYLPLSQYPRRAERSVVVRTTGDPMLVADVVRNEIRALDRGLPVFRVQSMGTIVSDSVSQTRFTTLLLSLFAGAAAFLAAVGVYGVVSHVAIQRNREIGLRMAVGATQGQILGLVLGQGSKLILLGVGLGLAGSWALSRVLATLLFGVSAVDPAIFAAVTGLSAAVALAACYFPARRATKVDPMVALRCE